MNPNASYRIYGSDIDPRALSAARASIQAANLERVFVQKRDVGACQSRFETGVVIANPPYGERLEDEARVDALYREMGLHFQRQFPSWSYYFLTPSETFETLFSLKATRRRKLYNGGLKCCYYQFQRPR